MTPRRFLITGGSQGIGAALVDQARAAGHHATFTGRDHARVAALAASTGAHGVVADVTSGADNQRAVDEAVSRMGGIDVLVNNAGFVYRAEIGALDLDKMRAVFETNVFGLVDLTNRAVPHLKQAGFGDIVNIASTSGMKGAPAGTAYSGSKWAVRGITQCWQAELRPSNIRVSCICPSEVQTSFGGRTGRNNPNKLYAADIAATILAGVGLPQRVLWTELAIFATNPWKED